MTTTTTPCSIGGAHGCTHVTELTQILPTAVVQAFAGQVIDTRGDAESSPRPFQIDRCHALKADGPIVETHYPRWYRGRRDAVDAGLPSSDAGVTSDH